MNEKIKYLITKPSIENQNKITLLLNHLLVLYTFLIPINNDAKSSMFFVMLILFLYRRDYWKYLKDALNNKIVQACLLFYIVNLLGMTYTDNIDYGKDHMDRVKYLLFPLVFLSFLDVRFAFRIVAAFILGMLVAELFSYFIYFQLIPYEFYIGKYEIYETTLRSPSPFLSHSDHGVGLALIVSILLYAFLNNKYLSIWYKIGIVFIIISSTLNMFFMASRTGYIIYLLLVMFVILITYRKNLFRYLIVTVLFLTLVSSLAYNYSKTVNFRVNELTENTKKTLLEQKYLSGSVGLRVGFTVYSWDIIKDNILIGVGTGDHMDKVREIIPEKYSLLKDPDNMGKPHNVYIQILLQQGLIGLIAFIYLIYTILSYKNIPIHNKHIIYILVVSTLISMLSGMFYGSFELPLLLVIVSAMIVQKQQHFEVDKVDINLIFKYFCWIFIFLIIGITR